MLALALGLVLFGAARCMPQKNLVPIEVTDLTLDTTEENAGGVTETKSSEVIIGGSLKEAAHLHDSNELVVTLSVLVDKPRDFKPQQRLLTLSHAERKTRAAKFVGDVRSAGEGSLRVEFRVTAEAIEKQVGTLNGEYSAEVIVADSAFEESYRTSFGKIVVSHAHQEDGSLSVDPEPSARESAYELRKEFEHVMRPADKRAPSAISLVFAGAMFCPLVLLVPVAASAGANLKKLPSVFLSAVLFHAAVAATLGVIVYYWLSLPFLKTLPILSGLSAFAALAGFHLLRGLCKEKAD